MTPQELQQRTKQFALRVIRLTEALPRRRAASVIGGQLLRAGTSVGANYRAACRARSCAEFVAQIGVVEEEADESLYWMELLVEAGIRRPSRVASLMEEAGEIVAIMSASMRTARGSQRRSPNAERNRQSEIRNPQ